MGNNINVIKPGGFTLFEEIKQLWNYRSIFEALVTRDLKVRYKQTLIGGLWAILQPLTTMVVFSFFFGNLAKIPSEGLPYPVFSYSGLILWTYFSGALNRASNSTVSNSNLITKVYFPRLIIPISSTLAGLVDYFISFIVLLIMMSFYNINISYSVIFILPIVLITWLLATGIGFWLASINVWYRDIRIVVPFLIQILLFISPVIYPTSVAGRFKKFLIFNPLTGLLELHRSLILGIPIDNFYMVVVSVVLTLLIFLTGMYFYKKSERSFADII